MNRKTTNRLLCVFSVLILAPGHPVFSSRAVTIQDACKDATTQVEMNQCSAKEAQDADKQLNDLYRTVLEKLTPDNKNSLRVAQRAWIAYRDADCAGEAELYKGGSIAPLIKTACVAKLTNERIAEIKRIYVDSQAP